MPGPIDTVGRVEGQSFFVIKTRGSCAVVILGMYANYLRPAESAAATSEQRSHGWVTYTTPVGTVACTDRDELTRSVTVIAPGEAANDLATLRILLDAVGTEHWGARYGETTWAKKAVVAAPARPPGSLPPLRLVGRFYLELATLRPTDTALATHYGARFGGDIAVPLGRSWLTPMFGLGMAGGGLDGNNVDFRTALGFGVVTGPLVLAGFGTAGVDRVGPGDAHLGFDAYLGVEGLARISLGPIGLAGAVLGSPDQTRMWAAFVPLLGGRAVSLGIESIRFQPAATTTAGRLLGLFVGLSP